VFLVLDKMVLRKSIDENRSGYNCSIHDFLEYTMKRSLVVFILAIGFVSGMNAQSVSSPTFIISGNPISASDMTAYLGTLVTAINNLQTTVTALQSADTANMPVGTVIASFIAPDASNNYMTGSTVWALADDTNPYGSYTGPFPDMRGQFIRGMNVGGGIDPETRGVGDPQTDAFQGHAHKWLHQYGGVNAPYSSVIGTSNSDNNIDNGTLENATHPMTIITDRVNGTPSISTETRPDNIAVYWYIKVR